MKSTYLVLRFIPLFLISIFLVGCVNRSVNPPLKQINLNEGYRDLDRFKGNEDKLPETLVLLAFSGGGTRAAAFSYGVLEALREIELKDSSGKKFAALNAVNIISGVSGGSFTALAYGLYGQKLFDTYETDFLKRDVQGDLISRAIDPFNWGKLASNGWGRSDMAAAYYDEILFHGATYADLIKTKGPFILASATDISTGAGFTFNQAFFDYLCSDLAQVPLARAAASSSAVPVVLSPVTITNYGGSCQFKEPEYLKRLADLPNPPRSAARLLTDLRNLSYYRDSKKSPFIHLVDGGLADNLAMREILNFLFGFEAAHLAGQVTPFDGVKRIIVLVVNSLSSPSTDWNKSVNGPNSLDLLLKATGVPIDHYSYEEVERLRDIKVHWNNMRKVRDSGLLNKNKDKELARIIDTPNVDLYTIDVSFKQLADAQEYQYLNSLPTSFSLPSEAVDRLRVAAKKIILSSPEFNQILKDQDLQIVK